MCRVAHVNRAHSGPSFAIHTSNRSDCRRVRNPVVDRRRTGVRRDHHRRVGLGDAIGDRRGGDVVVIGRAREAPAVTGVRAGGGVCRVAHVNRAHCGPSLPVHTGDRRDGRRVRKTGVSRAGTGVGRHHHRRVRLVDRQRSSAGGDGATRVCEYSLVLIAVHGHGRVVDGICRARGAADVAEA